MTPEKVARKIIELGDSITDNSVVENCIKDIKRSPNKFSKVKKRREIKRRYERAGNIKLSKEDSKTVKLRLQKELIERGEKPNFGSDYCVKNCLAYTKILA